MTEARNLGLLSFAAHAEMMLLWKVFDIVQQHYFSRFIFESDCQVVINQINKREQYFIGLGVVVEGFQRHSQATDVKIWFFFFVL